MNAGAMHGIALLAQILALARIERGQEVFEAGVAPVVPVVLAADARSQAGFAQQGMFLRGWKQHMPAAGAQRFRSGRHGADNGPCQRGVIDAGGHKQARAAAGSEGDGCHQFRVVGPAMLTVGIGPGPVEHILPPGMPFEVERQGCCGVTFLQHQQMLRLPAGGLRGTAGVFQSA